MANQWWMIYLKKYTYILFSNNDDSQRARLRYSVTHGPRKITLPHNNILKSNKLISKYTIQDISCILRLGNNLKPTSLLYEGHSDSFYPPPPHPQAPPTSYWNLLSSFSSLTQSSSRYGRLVPMRLWKVRSAKYYNPTKCGLLVPINIDSPNLKKVQTIFIYRQIQPRLTVT